MPQGARQEPDNDPTRQTGPTVNPAAGPLPLAVLFLILLAIGLGVGAFVVMRTMG